MARLLVVDTETGGVDPARHSLLSLAAIVWNDGTLEDEFEVLVAEPDLVVTARALEINHIDLVQHSRQALAPIDAMAKFQRFLDMHFMQERAQGEKIVLVGHNVSFDVGFIRRLCAMSQVKFDDLFSHRTLDTASILRFLSLAKRVPERATASTGAFEVFGIPITEGERHTALGDARATALLLTALVSAISGADGRDTVFAAA